MHTVHHIPNSNVRKITVIAQRSYCVSHGVSAVEPNVFLKARLLPIYRLPIFGLIFFLIYGTFENAANRTEIPSNDKLIRE
jgi:hypothetical protein